MASAIVLSTLRLVWSALNVSQQLQAVLATTSDSRHEAVNYFATTPIHIEGTEESDVHGLSVQPFIPQGRPTRTVWLIESQVHAEGTSGNPTFRKRNVQGKIETACRK